MELRPLSFGEIFDRAITLYIRNFVPFAGIVLVLIVPLSVIQYVSDVFQQPQLDAMLQMLKHPGQVPAQPVPTIFDSPGAASLFIVALLFTYLLWPFMQNAVAVGVARLYGNKPVEFRACYEAVLTRWVQILAVLGIELGIVLGLSIAAAIVFGMAVAIAIVLATASGVFAAIGAIFAVILFLAALVLIAPLGVALTFSLYAVVIDEPDVVKAIRLGFSRVFNRTEFWRAVLFAIAAGAVTFAATAVVGGLELVLGMFHLTMLEVILQSLVQVAITPFGAVLLAVYYFDVRIRHEGFDLEAALERLAAGSQTA